MRVFSSVTECIRMLAHWTGCVQHDDAIEVLASNRSDSISRSTYAFCHGDRGAITTA
jgi:hypothetical protein